MRICRIVATEALSLIDLCDRFLNTLGSAMEPGDDAAQFLRRLEDALGNDSGLPLLLLDDVHRMSGTVLGNLLTLWHKAKGEGCPFGLVLAVERSLEGRLAKLAEQKLEPDALHIITLYPLTEKQTQDYIQQQLQAAGNDGSLLSEAEGRRVFRESQGMPGAINRQATAILVRKGGQRHKTKPAVKASAATRAKPGRGMAIAVGGLLVLGVGLFVVAQLIEPSANEPDTLELAIPSDAAEAGDPFGLPMPNRYAYGNNLDSDVVAEADAEGSAAERSQVIESPDGAEEAADTSKVSDAAEKAPPAAPSPLLIEEIAEDKPPVEVEAKPVAVATPRGVEWVREKAPGRFTIQLIAAYDRQALLQYIEEQNLSDTVELVRTRRNGRDWYVVLTGDYPNQDAAVAALRQLPSSLRASGAWVRSFGSVQQSLPN
ncbi:hypothetical protein CAI21_11620 [Alkalilimnicola ehrlichii]|uniref:SPOR domain-containing protein n=1 Tax=Alkalilimnicola ehrlichii TaxID=351052 RepID=UPI000E2EF9EA|nr:hypothetical protein CAI21_11620 [Alkalilimnicola ehrlichii]